MTHQCVPDIWLLSDARNDAVLEQALAALPPRSGMVFRHYHLGGDERRRRFDALAAQARTRGVTVVLSGSAEQAQRWGADGVYGAPHRLGEPSGFLRLATAHGAAELQAAQAAAASAAFLSPVFPTRSHAGTHCLGPDRFLELARSAALPVIALGGMDARRAAQIAWPCWGAIDGLTTGAGPASP